MKKLLSLLLALCLLSSLCLVGCENAFGNSPATTASGENGANNAANENHFDVNNDGKCDDCGISVIIELDMFAVNDLHGKVCDSESQPGVDELTTYLKNAYETEDHVLILSSGDMWQGSAESNLTKGLIVTEWMNELDFASMTLGNHEYDWGEDFIKANAEIAEFPFLAINIYDSDTNKRADYCAPSVTVERGGATIGIIGAIGDCYSSISGEHSGGVYFKVGNELTALVKAEAKRLRDEGADFIIYSIHDGRSGSSSGVGNVSYSQLASYYDAVLSDGYVDIVFEGHTHSSYVLKDSSGVYHLQNGGDNTGISYAEATINFANGTSSINDARYVRTSEYQSLEDDPIVNTLMGKYKDQIAEASRVLGMNDVERSGNELRQIMSELYLKAGLEAFGSEYNIVLGGGYISVRSPGRLAVGEVIFSQIQGLFPFENELVLCSVKGSDLLNKFINTNNSNYFIAYSEYGASVKDSIDPNGTYYIVTDTYSSTYAPNRLTEIKRYTAGVFAQHLLADYIEAGGLTSGNTEIVYTSIKEALNIGWSIPEGHHTNDYFYVKGTVVSVENTEWGNMYIADSEGNRLYIYGTYNKSGNIRYDAMENPPKVGDTVVLYGQITHYVSKSGEKKIEIVSARIIPEE